MDLDSCLLSLHLVGKTYRARVLHRDARVHNKNEDFYATVQAGAVPEHDVLITNPPFSGQHMGSILKHCATSGKPWLLVSPRSPAAAAPSLPAAQLSATPLCSISALLPTEAPHSSAHSSAPVSAAPACPHDAAPRVGLSAGAELRLSQAVLSAVAGQAQQR